MLLIYWIKVAVFVRPAVRAREREREARNEMQMLSKRRRKFVTANVRETHERWQKGPPSTFQVNKITHRRSPFVLLSSSQLACCWCLTLTANHNEISTCHQRVLDKTEWGSKVARSRVAWVVEFTRSAYFTFIPYNWPNSNWHSN